MINENQLVEITHAIETILKAKDVILATPYDLKKREVAYDKLSDAYDTLSDLIDHIHDERLMAKADALRNSSACQQPPGADRVRKNRQRRRPEYRSYRT